MAKIQISELNVAESDFVELSDLEREAIIGGSKSYGYTSYSNGGYSYGSGYSYSSYNGGSTNIFISNTNTSSNNNNNNGNNGR